jgi:hypothetical protein
MCTLLSSTNLIPATNIQVRFTFFFFFLFLVCLLANSTLFSLAANGGITFTDIHIEWEGKEVTPQWVGKTFDDACNCEPTILSPHSVKFTWDTSL